ncbi:MAG TPA: ABC transporter permease [Vicinamibacterales bacterium]|nr:ABC transporter permease [Vicinamibacterales bacterium]
MAVTARRAVLLLAPIMALILAAFVWPAVRLGRISLVEATTSGAMTDAVTIANYTAFFSEPANLELAVNSLLLSAVVTVITLICAYPLAIVLHRAAPRWQPLLFALTISPLLVSSVVRTYGWMALLGDRGPVNALLLALDVVAEPVRLVNNTLGVTIGLVEILMPYMTLSLVAGFGRLDVAYEEAAASLGAGPVQRFRRVVFPLTLPGVALGCGLTFVLTMSSFITPKLLGGGRVFLLATEIYDLAIVRLQWPTAATLAVIVLAVLGVTTAWFPRLARRFD